MPVSARTLRGPRFLALLCALGLVGAARAAEPGPLTQPSADAAGAGRPSAVAGASDHVVTRFDFEERDKLNFEDLPMHWFAIGRPPDAGDADFARLPVHAEALTRGGYPNYNDVRFDRGFRVSGRYSFHLGIKGGSAGAFLEAGTLAAIPGSDYSITSAVRTEDVEHARARLVAYFVDDRGRRIDASVAQSEPVDTGGAWASVSVQLAGAFPKAAWIGLEVQLNQPDASDEPSLGRHRLVYRDVRGGAWFDDITVRQVPHVGVRTQSPVNLIRAPERPRLTLQVRELTGRVLTADAAVYDHAMRRVAGARQRVGDGAPSTWSWEPRLERFGWYLCDLNVLEGRDAPADAPRVARSLTAFLWLGQEPPLLAPDAARFALVAEGASPGELELLPQLMEKADVGAAVLSCWERGTTLRNLDAQQSRLDALVQTLVTRGRSVGLSLAPLPDELAGSLDLDGSSPLGMFAKPQASWLPFLGPTLLRHGQRVRYWQAGTPSQADAFYLPALTSLLATAAREWQGLVPQAEIALPWRLEQGRRAELGPGQALAVDVGPGVRPADLGEAMDALRAPSVPAVVKPRPAGDDGKLWLYLREPPADALPHPARVVDLAQRMLRGWEAGAAGLAITRPWAGVSETGTSVAPDPLLGVFSTVAHRLADRKVLGNLSFVPGTRCLVLGGPGGGALATWNESAAPGEAVIDAYLGAAPVAVDVWGNRATIPLENGRHRLALTDTPVFIEGADPALALFRAGFAMTPAFLDSTQAAQRRTITLVNPWPRTISGYMTITEPRDWRIEPQRSYFSIAAGATAQVPVEVVFSASEVAGPKRLGARFDFTADARQVIEATAPLEVGLKDVDFDATLAVEPGKSGSGRDAVVTQIITNRSPRPLALYAFAAATGYARQERLISRLEPGQSVVRRFRFADVPSGEAPPMRVGVREASGPAVLNKVLGTSP